MRLTKKALGELTRPINYPNVNIQKLPNASFLFVTYNRCPYRDFFRNPLVWSIQSLLANQQAYLINDYVIIDDCSSDFTKEVVDWLMVKYQLPITYHRNSNRQEYSTNRRRGIHLTKNRLVFMGDDDCIFSTGFIVGGLLTYQLLMKKHPQKKLAIVNFSVYEKNPVPTRLVGANEIGQLEPQRVFFSHNFDAFPDEYLKKPQYLDQGKTILKPLKVKTFSGVNLCDKKLILKAGNYLDLSMWRFGYSEHLELSYQINRRGYAIYHQPDPRISSIHLKYGARSKDVFDHRFGHLRLTNIRYTLGQLVAFSQRKSNHTGSRSSDEEFHIIEIGSIFSFYLKISSGLANRYARKEYEHFVKQNHIYSTTPSGTIKAESQRQDIWRKAIDLGCRNTTKQTKVDYTKLAQTIIDEHN